MPNLTSAAAPVLRRAAFVALISLAASGLSAQLPTSTDAPTTPTAPPQPLQEQLHPRATMTTFLSAFKKAPGELGGRQPAQAAAACLDLSAVPAQVRSIKGAELAVELKDVIDRLAYVQLDELPDEPDGPPFVFHRDVSGEIVIARGDDGNWRFTVATVASIPELWSSVSDRQLVEGVEQAARTPALWLRARVPPPLREQRLLLEDWQWLGLLTLALLGWLLDRVVGALVRGIAVRFLSSHQVLLDPTVVQRGLRPVGLLATALVWATGVAILDLPVRLLQILLVAARFLAISAVVWSAYRLTDIVSAVFAERASKTESRFDDLLVPMFRKAVKVLVAVFGVVFIADNLDLDISSLIAGLGIGGIALALAAQDTVKNLFGSLTVLTDRPFQVGDFVNVGGVEGTIEEVGFRSTRIRTPLSSLVTLPNATLINAAVDNFGARLYRRWRTVLALEYDTPPEKVEAFCEGVRELIRRAPETRKEAFQVWFNEFGASSLDVLLIVFFAVPDYDRELAARHRLAVGILRLAKRLGVGFAYPTQTLYLSRATAEAGADSDAYEEVREGALGDARSAAAALLPD